MKSRISKIARKTKETDVNIELNIDGSGNYEIDTSIPFFNHMLELFARHGLFDLKIKASGDIDIDYHHTVEDVGIVLGRAFREALGDKAGIFRYGFFILPMDETLVRVALDLSNRPIWCTTWATRTRACATSMFRFAASFSRRLPTRPGRICMCR